MDIPPEIQIKSTLEEGSVFYFEEETLTSTEPHYFVVLNNNPQTDVLLLLVFSSSQISNVKLRNINNNPSKTLIEVSPNEYPAFSKNSIFDCNTIRLKTVNELIEKLSSGKLKLKPSIPASLLDRLRAGVKASPVIPDAQKRILIK